MTSYLNNSQVIKITNPNVETIQKILDGQSVTTYQIISIHHSATDNYQVVWIYFSGEMKNG